MNAATVQQRAFRDRIWKIQIDLAGVIWYKPRHYVRNRTVILVEPFRVSL